MELVIRSTVFHIAFLSWTFVCAVLMLPTLLLPRRMAIVVFRAFFKSYIPLERYILGLDYEVRGFENLPQGPCILACMHQSAYETLKLHPIFGDVAIVLKRELMWIPLWGWYQAKSGVIPLDRGAGGVAMRSLLDGAAKPLAEGRHIAIFPQGTRLPPGDKKPYKQGIAFLYEKYDVPVVPIALNSGRFWPKHAFLIKPGKVVFDILPPLPAGLERQQVVPLLQSRLDEACQRLDGELHLGVSAHANA